jgi:hypothetical protein
MYVRSDGDSTGIRFGKMQPNRIFASAGSAPGGRYDGSICAIEYAPCGSSVVSPESLTSASLLREAARLVVVELARLQQIREPLRDVHAERERMRGGQGHR